MQRETVQELSVGLSLNDYGYGADTKTLIRAIKNAGFSSFFTKAGRGERELDEIYSHAASAGLILESLHAGFGGISTIWQPGEAGEAWVERLCRDLALCRRYDAGYLTVHCMNVPEKNRVSDIRNSFSEIGAERFARVVSYAESIGVKMALENVEFPDLELTSLIGYLKSAHLTAGLGFTWDVGHWHCYPANLSFEEAFGDLLIGTHIHDNFGNRDREFITWKDDNHILPFDGTVDFREVGNTLKRCGYRGSITLEVGRNHVMPWYTDYPDLESYLAVLYERATHVAMLAG